LLEASISVHFIITSKRRERLGKIKTILETSPK